MSIIRFSLKSKKRNLTSHYYRNLLIESINNLNFSEVDNIIEQMKLIIPDWKANL